MKYIWYANFGTAIDSIEQNSDKQFMVFSLTNFIHTQPTYCHTEDFIQFSKNLSFDDWIFLRKENSFSIYQIIGTHNALLSWKVVPIRVDLESLLLQNEISFLQRNFTLITNEEKIKIIHAVIQN